MCEASLVLIYAQQPSFRQWYCFLKLFHQQFCLKNNFLWSDKITRQNDEVLQWIEQM